MSYRSETPNDRHAGTATCTPSTNRIRFRHMIFDRGALCHRGRIVGGGLCSSRRTLSTYAGGSEFLWSLCLNRSENLLLTSVLTTSITLE